MVFEKKQLCTVHVERRKNIGTWRGERNRSKHRGICLFITAVCLFITLHTGRDEKTYPYVLASVSLKKELHRKTRDRVEIPRGAEEDRCVRLSANHRHASGGKTLSHGTILCCSTPTRRRRGQKTQGRRVDGLLAALTEEFRMAWLEHCEAPSNVPLAGPDTLVIEVTKMLLSCSRVGWLQNIQ